MNVTEHVIVEQFPFWAPALTQALPAFSASTLVVVGCGTSYYLAQSVASALNLNGQRAIAVPGGEWARRPNAYLADLSDVGVIALSRSGESTETVQAVDASRALGIKTLGITCERESSLAKNSDQVLFAPTHAMEGIVMSSSASLMLLLGLRLAGVDLDPAIAASAEQAMQALDRQLDDKVLLRSHFVYLGGGALLRLGQRRLIEVAGNEPDLHPGLSSDGVSPRPGQPGRPENLRGADLRPSRPRTKKRSCALNCRPKARW